MSRLIENALEQPSAQRSSGHDEGSPQRGSLLKRFRSNRLAAVSAIFLFIIITVVLFPAFFSPYDPNHQSLIDRLQAPSKLHWLGTDDYGRDQLSRLVYGTRSSIYAGALALIIATSIAVPLGLIAGHLGGIVDTIVRTTFDALMSVPAIILAIAVVAALGPGLTNGMIAIGLIFSPRLFRVQRGATIDAKANLYVEACEAIGCSRWRILWRHLVPNTFSVTLVQLSLLMGLGIIAEAGLSFIGLGAQPPTASLGTLLRDAYPQMERSPYLVMPAGLMIVLIVLALSLCTDGLDDAINRRKKPQV